MARHTRSWQEFVVESLGTLVTTIVCLVVGLVGAVVLAWATGATFRIVLAPGATDVRAALTAVAALFVVGAGVFLALGILQKAIEVLRRHRRQEALQAAAAAAAARESGADAAVMDEETAAVDVVGGGAGDGPPSDAMADR